MDHTELKKQNTRRIFFAFVVAGIIDLFFTGTYLPANPFFPIGPYIMMFFPSILLVIIVAKFIKHFPAIPILFSILILCMTWPIAAIVPFNLREITITKKINSFQDYPSSSIFTEEMERAMDGSVAKIFSVPTDVRAEDIVAFYESQYKKMGWAVENKRENYSNLPYLDAKKGRFKSSVHTRYYWGNSRMDIDTNTYWKNHLGDIKDTIPTATQRIIMTITDTRIRRSY